jgi:hypothetical protein
MATKKIDKLTPEQEVKIEEWKQKWLKEGRSTERCERKKAEDAMTEVYKWMGYKKPKFFWTESPLECITLPVMIENWEKTTNKSVKNLTQKDFEGLTLDGLSPEAIKEEKKKNLYNSFDGIRYFYWFPFYSVGELIADDINTPEDKHKIKVLTALFESSGWFLLYEEACFFAERPTELHLDTDGRLHNINGACIKFSDGFGLYYYHGREMNKEYIEDHSKITVSVIEKEANAEVRRCLLEIYDQDRPGQFLLDSGAKPIDSDDFGTLYRKEIPGDEAMVFVKVTNSTPESDGHFKDYMLRAQPDLRPMKNGQLVGEAQKLTAVNAVGSLHGMTGEEYKQGLANSEKAGLLAQS